jgi:acyl dehydratase
MTDNAAPTRYFEDFQIGETWQSPPMRITADMIMDFGRNYDPQPMHTDPAWAAQGPFGGLIASGWLIASLTVKAFVQAGGYGKTPAVGLGIDELRWSRIVKVDDTITMHREIIELRQSSSSPGQGIIRTRVTVRNQASETVMSMVAAGRVPLRAGLAASQADKAP